MDNSSLFSSILMASLNINYICFRFSIYVSGPINRISLGQKQFHFILPFYSDGIPEKPAIFYRYTDINGIPFGTLPINGSKAGRDKPSNRNGAQIRRNHFNNTVNIKGSVPLLLTPWPNFVILGLRTL